MELLMVVVVVWCYLVIGFAVLALFAAGIEPFDTGDAGDAGIATIFFWPIVLIRTLLQRRWRFRRVDAALKETRRQTRAGK